MSDLREIVEAEARRTNGVIQRRDALAAGMTVAQVDRRVRRGQWRKGCGPATYLLAEMAEDPFARLASAVVGLDAVGWGASALAVWGLGQYPTMPIVALPVQLRRPGGAEIRSVAALGALPITSYSGIAMASLELAVASMASERSDRGTHDLVDRVIREQRTTWERLAEVFDLYRRRGRPGSGTITRLLEERSGEGSVPLSIWSRDVKKLLADAGFNAPEMEWRVGDEAGRLVAQVDLAYPAAKYAIELDSVAFHLNRQAFVEDRRRDAALARVGWLSRRFTWDQFRDELDLVLATIRADLAAR